MSDDQQIREKLRKIKSLFAGASSQGERDAAQAAMNRLNDRINAGDSRMQGGDPPVEFRFSFENAWSMRLFLALCRSKGFRPYRYPRMRRTSVCVRIGAQALNSGLWPEYLEMNRELTRHLGTLADQIIADCISPDGSDAEVVMGLPTTAAADGEMQG